MNVEEAVIAYLTPVLDPIPVTAVTWVDLVSRIPVVKVTGQGGTRRFSLAVSTVYIEALDVSRVAAMDLSERIDRIMRLQMHGVIGDSVVTHVRTQMSPRWVDYAAFQAYGDPVIHRFVATYVVYLQTP